MRNKIWPALLPLTAMGMVFFTAPIRLYLSPHSAVDCPVECSFRELPEAVIPAPSDPSTPLELSDPIEPAEPSNDPLLPDPPDPPVSPAPPKCI